MERKIHKLLREIVGRKNKTLNEGIKIFKSNPSYHKAEGLGYWLYLSSDNEVGEEYKDETLDMSKELNLTDASKFFKERGFVPPQHTNKGGLKAGVNPETGQFGWGYFITKVKENSPGYVEGKLENLKELVRDYNNKKNLEDDIKTGGLSLKQVGQIQNLTSAIEDSIDREMNPETKAKLEKYLDELSESIENDEVFEFLTQKYNEASEFIKRNVSAGTQSHPYSISNSMIILAADPNAILAAQKSFWEGRNYRIKDTYKHGISISIPRTTKTQGTAKNILKKPGAWDAYKQQQGIDQGTSFSQHIKSNPAKHNVDIAHSAIRQKAVRTGFGDFSWGTVYTDTMVEPIPGKEVESIQDMIGIVDNTDSFHIPQKELDSSTHKEKLNVLFKALFDVAEDAHINTSGISFKDGDINEFNKLLNNISFDEASNRLPRKMGISTSQITPQVEEMLYGYSEAISNVVKKHFGLPSEESKYNVARQGIDRDEIEKVYGEIIRISDNIIKSLNSKMKSQPEETLNEVRKIIRDVIRKNL